MNMVFIYGEHHQSSAEWSERGLIGWLSNIFEAPDIKIQPRCTSAIREYVTKEFLSEGWAINVRIHPDSLLKVFAMKDDLAFQLQTGNMSRVPYDLLKLQYMFQRGKIKTAAIAIPTLEAAKKMGDNIANAERVCRELKLFDRVITIPVLVVAFG